MHQIYHRRLFWLTFGCDTVYI